MGPGSDKRRTPHRAARGLGLGLALLGCWLTACKDEVTEIRHERVALVTDGPAGFWSKARDGTEQATEEFGTLCEFRVPTYPRIDLQRAIIDDLIERRVPGMIICPIDPAEQSADLARACKHMSVICIRRDAPDSERRCFVSTDERIAGHLLAAGLIDSLAPEADVLVLVGETTTPAAEERLAGLTEALASSPSRVVTQLAVGQDMQDAAARLQEALGSLNLPAGLIALQEEQTAVIHAVTQGGGLPAELVIIASGDAPATLRAIETGRIQRSVASQPGEISFHAVRILRAVLAGDMSALPEDGAYRIPPLAITPTNVDVFLDHVGSAPAPVATMPTTTAPQAAHTRPVETKQSSPPEFSVDDPGDASGAPRAAEMAPPTKKNR